MGMLNSMKGRFDTAEKLLKEALALRPKGPDDAKALTGLGEVYLMQDRVDLARDFFRKAASTHPGTEEAKIAQRYLQNLP
jgi:Flp pilus assembly protein TadD